MSLPHVVLLGPQRLEPTVVEAVDDLGVTGPIALVTAGWEEREAEDQELGEHLRGRCVNLRLFARAEELFLRDADLLAEMMHRNDRMRALQELYRLRLGHALASARELLARGADSDLLLLEQAEAIAAVRELDRRHQAHLAELHAEFEEHMRMDEREDVAWHREEIRRTLADCELLCVAGGHVQRLLNRLRLFDVLTAHRGRPVIAWSGGAMVLGPRVVLFHDSPPQGAGDPEVLELGVGLYSGVVPLPHAKKRLRLDDPTRVGLFARRFAPDRCVAFDGRTRADWDGERWTIHEGTRSLLEDGRVTHVAAEVAS